MRPTSELRTTANILTAKLALAHNDPGSRDLMIQDHIKDLHLDETMIVTGIVITDLLAILDDIGRTSPDHRERMDLLMRNALTQLGEAVF